MPRLPILPPLLLTLALAGCGGAVPPVPAAIPAPAEAARERIAVSTRHGEWVRIPAGGADSVRAWVVYPERSTRAPVVVVIHEIFGLTTWVRGVADQLAADGFIAVAPDLLTGKRMAMAPDSLWSTGAEGGVDSAVAMISALDYPEVLRRIEAAGRYSTGLPAAQDRWGVLGFCWGGSMALTTAGQSGSLAAAVSFYGGVTPAEADLSRVRAPTLALLAEDDARVNLTMAYADSSYRAAGVAYEQVTLPNSGHGFLRAQHGHGGGNLGASRGAWPRAIAWFRRHLGR
jgi:carboxymethylenebutenolidase